MLLLLQLFLLASPGLGCLFLLGSCRSFQCPVFSFIVLKGGVGGIGFDDRGCGRGGTVALELASSCFSNPLIMTETVSPKKVVLDHCSGSHPWKLKLGLSLLVFLQI